jgi:uncharacterized lipoprotein YajG
MMEIPGFIAYEVGHNGEMKMKSLIIPAVIALLAGCAGTHSDRQSGSSSTGESSASSGSNPRLDKQPDDLFHSWIN